MIEEIPGGSENLQLQDEWGIFFETASTKCCKASSPVEVQQSSSLLTGSPGTILEQSSELGPIDQKPPESTDVLRQFTKEQQLSTMDYQQLLSDAEERAAELLATNQQLTATLVEVKERMEGLGVENEQLKHELTVCSDSEALKKELQQGQNRIKELWKKNCEQVKEFDLIIWEKDKELESLKGAAN